jgi:oligopeptidase A
MSAQVNPLANPVEGLLDYSSIRPEHIGPAIETQLARAKEAVNAAADPNLAATWDAIVTPLDKATEHLWRVWSVAGHLNLVVNTPELRDAYNAMLGPITEYSTWVGLHSGLYKQYQRLHASPEFASLGPARKRVIELALRNFKLSGVELEGQARKDYTENSEKQSQVSQKFSENVMDARDTWILEISDQKQLAGLPKDVLTSLWNEEKKAWVLTLKMPCYLPVMQYAHDRELRQRVYKAYATVASEFGPSEQDNSTLIEEALALRAQEAALLGFKNFTELRLQTRMAQSDQEVVDFLRALSARAKPFAERDLAELKTFASKQLSITELQAWDVAYASEHLREARYAYSEDEVKQYFTEPRVMAGLFDVVHKLFGVVLKPMPLAGWHEDASAAAVINAQGITIGYLLMDLYARNGKQGGAWVDSERTRQKREHHLQLPIINLTCNFARPQGARPAVWTHDDVITLFHESGHALHALLSEVDEAGASAFAAVEWDAIELPSQFMENFCWDWSVLQQLTAHVDTGKTLPRELFDKMTAARNFQSGMQTVRQIEFALFDIFIHTQSSGLAIDEVMTILKKVRTEVAVMQPPDWHRFPHSFSHLFAGGYGAGYYSYKWAEVLSADAFEAFEEAVLQQSPEQKIERLRSEVNNKQNGNEAFDIANKKMSSPQNASTLDAVIGARFKQEILAVGGVRPAAESFKAFRGREPKIDALLRHSGMTNEATQAGNALA